jgi:AAA domain
MSALTADAALEACRAAGLDYRADEHSVHLWHARCPVCIVTTEGHALTIRETQRGKPAQLSCRNGCAGIERALRDALGPHAVTPGGRVIVAESFASIRTERPRWAWAGRIPLRAPTLLVGREKLGKSTLTVALAAGVSRGTLPGDLAGEPSSVLLLSYEDSAASTVKPRLGGG